MNLSVNLFIRASLLFGCSCLFLPVISVAGELTSQPRISNNGRNIRQSTSAARALSRKGRDMGKIYTLRSSNLFESRLLDQQRARLKYEADLLRWENRVAKMETAAERKEERELSRQRDRMERRLEKEKRDEQRALERKERGNMLSRFNDDGEETVTEEDQKKRRAEAFFGEKGTDRGLESAPDQATPSEPREAKPRLSFWQRLKRAIFGS